MRFTSVVLLTAVAALAGCSRFHGEWVQDAQIDDSGTAVPTTGIRHALRFDGPATVMHGMYSEPSGAVSAESVTINNFWTLKNDTVAQFGEYNAYFEDGYLVTDIGGTRLMRFARAKGPSIFPPRVRLPAI